jgi:hypothetical protein
MFHIMRLRIRLFCSKKIMIAIFVFFPVMFSLASINYLRTDDFTVRTSIGIVDLDNTDYSEHVIHRIKKDTTLRVMTYSLENGEEALFKESITGLYILTEGFEQKIKSGKTLGLIQVKYLSDNYTAPGITDLITPYFLLDLIKETTLKQVSDIEFSNNPEGQADFSKRFQDYAATYEELDEFKLEVIVKRIEEHLLTEPLFSFSKEIVIRYFLSIILIFLFISAVYQSIQIATDKQDKIVRRIRLSSCGYIDYLIGNLLGIAGIVFLIGILQIILLKGMFFKDINLLFGAINLLTYVISITLMAMLFMMILKSGSNIQTGIPYMIIVIWFLGGWVYSDIVVKSGFSFMTGMIPGMLIKDHIIGMFLTREQFFDTQLILKENLKQMVMLIIIYGLGRMEFEHDTH